MISFGSQAFSRQAQNFLRAGANAQFATFAVRIAYNDSTLEGHPILLFKVSGTGRLFDKNYACSHYMLIMGSLSDKGIVSTIITGCIQKSSHQSSIICTVFVAI
jgi:hypothetical protein